MIDVIRMQLALERIAQDFGRAPEPLKVINERLAHHNFNPDDVALIGESLLNHAIQSGEAPEEACRGMFTMGIILGSMLGDA